MLVSGWLFIGIYILCYFGSHLHFSWKQVVPGAVFTTVFFALFSFYNVLYGSIKTILILMLWFYINNLWILLGHEIITNIWH
ncbi:YhjD/YihY/BrkB family envelope integrity protein [Bacteroidetes bacterium endosymbiont of Geopemphigus sp.]|uniref:YhjD/YihY/BrkB family envelope integrity protein n=1 Tax=Bacteroidetes bacterium endosymbiont of Geopemphigus sp. TaxID=2047937 RepID=UPI003977B963